MNEFTGTATYSPEDNKLRLYVGRVPRDEYLRLRAEGWTSTPKQDCDFVAHWTPTRRDTALEYAETIGDEDQGAEDRAADRAERFGDYRDKRTSEATGHADTYDAGPAVHGFQNQARAERSARRHDRQGTYATDAWSKAEYWQRRTAGVIANSLYKSSPGVRMGRIKVLEAELRKMRDSLKQYAALFSDFQKLKVIVDPEQQTVAVVRYVGTRHVWAEYPHPDEPESSKTSLYCLATSERRRKLTGAEIVTLFFSNHGPAAEETDWTKHLELRLAYENQMLEAQGGRAAFVEMEVGGWLGKYQIRKVNKSSATGRVVSVTLKQPGTRYDGNAPGFCLIAYNIERLPSDAYTPPTDADKASLIETKKAEKAAAPKVDTIPLVNPTDADAERLQQIWNEARSTTWEKEPRTVKRMTQAQYSQLSKGSCAGGETKLIAAGGLEPYSVYGRDIEGAVCKVRFISRSVIILTDKPQKPLPAEAFNSPRAAQLAIVQDSIEELQEICRLLAGSMKVKSELLTEEQRELFRLARLVGYTYELSMSQRGFTPAGMEYLRSRSQVIARMVAQSELFA